MVEIDGVYYAGNHGLEIAGPGIKFVSPSALAAQNEILELAKQLSDKLDKIEGVIVEDKGLSLSIHYRMVKTGDETVVTRIFHQTTSPLLNEGKIKVTAGKKVWEARPPINWHKGKAAEIIIQKIKGILNHQKLLTVYLGDDKTDEDVFKIIRHPQGWGIFIGGDNPSSSADYYLNSTAEVKTFLSRILNL
jgi:trehalose-phosphatase